MEWRQIVRRRSIPGDTGGRAPVATVFCLCLSMSALNSDMDVTTASKFNTRSSQLCNLWGETRVDGGMRSSNVNVHRENLALGSGRIAEDNWGFLGCVKHNLVLISHNNYILYAGRNGVDHRIAFSWNCYHSTYTTHSSQTSTNPRWSFAEYW